MKKVLLVLLVFLIIAGLVSVLLLVPGLDDTSTKARIVYNPYEMDGSWYKGQMHCHSNRSDGDLEPSAVVARYASLGFDFLALTDHNKITQVNGSITVLGQEYGKGSTESTSDTHMNGINVSYVPNRYATEQERVDNITGQNGIVSLNHPSFSSYAYDPEVMKALTNYTCLEIVNGKYLSMDTISIWDGALTAGKRVWGLAADDAHTPQQFGVAWIVVRISGEVSTDNVIDAIKRGSFYSSQGPEIGEINVSGTVLRVSSPGADNIRFYGTNGTLLARISGDEASYQLKGSEGYVRAVVNENGSYAWTQPVFVGEERSPPSSLGDAKKLTTALSSRTTSWCEPFVNEIAALASRPMEK